MSFPAPATWLRIAAALLICTAAGAQPAAPAKMTLNIKAQPIREALQEFGEQTRLQVLFRSEGLALEGITAPSLSGEFSAQEALDRLLANTGLKYEFVNERTVRIAQSDRVRSTDATGAAADKQPVEEVLVTGTHIRGVRADSSPVTIYTREDIEKSGVGTLEQFARVMPQNFSSMDGISATHTNNASGFDQRGTSGYGGAGFNLRGLGPTSTLVLVNGKRLSGSGDGDSVDISMIPLSAIEQIEVLPDGASAIYGADAVAGVVNIVLRRDFTGAETTLRYGDTSRGGAAETAASQSFGAGWGTGNATLIYEYLRKDPLRSTERDFIPDQGGPATMSPQQDQHGVFLMGRQDVSGTALTGDFSYSYRDNGGVDSFLFSAFTRSHVRSEQYRAIVGAAHDLPAGWRGELTGTYSKVDQALQTSQEFLGTVFLTDSVTDTSFRAADAKLDGPLFALPGGQARLAVGGGAHKEHVDNATGYGALDRTSSNVYAEAFMPFIGEGNARPWARRLELSLAGRYDRYSDFGSSVNPKVGLLWEPVRGFALRGSYTTSFRPPQLSFSLVIPNYAVYDIPEASEPDGFVTTLLDNSFGTNNLDAETSRSFNIGFDLKPAAVPGLSVSVSYFETRFEDRIGGPPIAGSLFRLYSEAETLAPFIDRTPDGAAVEQVFEDNAVIDARFLTNPGGPPLDPALVESTFDMRITNIAATRQSGIDLKSNYTLPAFAGELDFSLAGTYLLENKYQTVSTLPYFQLLNLPSQPMDFRMRGTAGWSRGGFGATLAVNYSDGYNNNLITPSGTVASWTTADLQLRQSFGDRFAPRILQDLTVALSIQNLTDRDPPPLSVSPLFIDFGFDASNASPIGRFISLQASKHW